jgi:hypothetical protein
MYKLTKAGKACFRNLATKRSVAIAMGVGEMAIYMNLKKFDGSSIATNYDGLNELMRISKMDESVLREKKIKNV